MATVESIDTSQLLKCFAVSFSSLFSKLLASYSLHLARANIASAWSDQVVDPNFFIAHNS